MTADAFWSGRRVLVTGCNGFLGSWLTRALDAAGAAVTGLIRDPLPDSLLVSSGVAARITPLPGDVTDLALLERAVKRGTDSVFHLAANALVGTAKRDPLAAFETNVRGTWNVLEACRRSHGVTRVVVASSDKAYGAHDRLPYEEHFPLEGRQPYDVSKSCADLISVAYHRAYGLPVAVTRCANLYGGGDLNWERIVPGTIRAAIEGTRPVIRSDGTPLRDYLYVEDAVRGYMRLAQAMDDRAIHGEAFNFGSGEPVAVSDLTRRILDLAGRRELEPEVLGQAGDEIPRQYLSADKARRLLGWSPATALDDGLREAIGWYRALLSGG